MPNPWIFIAVIRYAALSGLSSFANWHLQDEFMNEPALPCLFNRFFRTLDHWTLSGFCSTFMFNPRIFTRGYSYDALSGLDVCMRRPSLKQYVSPGLKKKATRPRQGSNTNSHRCQPVAIRIYDKGTRMGSICLHPARNESSIWVYDPPLLWCANYISLRECLHFLWCLFIFRCSI